MEPDHEKEIRQIIAEFDCPKNFICYKSGFTTLCKAKDIGLESYLECSDKSPDECMFLLSFANIRYCDCPLRCYIAKKLKK
jgi:hypothetical protein